MSKFHTVNEKDMYFYPFVACCNCFEITQDWKWVISAYNTYDEIYGVCKRCEFKVHTEGL